MSIALAEIYEQSAVSHLDTFRSILSLASRDTDEAIKEWRIDGAIDVWGKAQRNLVNAMEQRNV